jgi:hypothetical protein
VAASNENNGEASAARHQRLIGGIIGIEEKNIEISKASKRRKWR